MSETFHFINDGYGWSCKRCREAEAEGAQPSHTEALPRFFREGEAEEREPRLSSRALARWTDASRSRLVCPICGVEEELEA